MKIARFVTIVLIGFAALSLYNLKESSEPKEFTMFAVWKESNNKAYANEKEEIYRRGVWMDNYLTVSVHNARYARGLETYDMEMNGFADLTVEEFAEIYLNKFMSSSATSNCTGKQAPESNLPESVDWTAKSAVTGVKNQGQCGSCWAFSATGSLEGAHFLKEGSLSSFSEQQLVDCSHSYGNNGCGGGLMNLSFFYVIDHGITLESKYPYKGVGSNCRYTDADKAWTISNCVDVTVDKESALKASIAQQPVSVAIQANHLSFQLYKSGVYNGNCGTNLDHGVLAVGYGDLSGNKFWKVKNSWGSGWGQQGYIYIARNGDGKGKCGIQMAASFPVA